MRLVAQCLISLSARTAKRVTAQQALLPVLQYSVGRLRGAQMRRIERQRVPKPSGVVK